MWDFTLKQYDDWRLGDLEMPVEYPDRIEPVNHDDITFTRAHRLSLL